MSQRKQDLEAFIQEANQVRSLKSHPGWVILERDLVEYLRGASRVWMNYEKDTAKFKELRLNALAAQKILDLVDDYEGNRIKAEEEWLKESFPEAYVQSDIDNQTPLREEEE